MSAADYLKDEYKSATNDFKICAVEAVECPTLLTNGFGGHNIQGIGDKHVPLVHNVMNTDFLAGISDQVDQLLLLSSCSKSIVGLEGIGCANYSFDDLPTFL